MNLRIVMVWSLSIAGCLGERAPEAPDAGAADVPVASPDLGQPVSDLVQEDPGPSLPPPPDLLADGEACVASEECTSGRCAMPCEGYGFCAPAACQTDDDCLVDGTEATLCCEGGKCAPIAGAVCGDRKGQQGAACGATGQSACTEGLKCTDACQPTAYCAAACDDDAACEALDPELGCWTVSGLGKRCVVDPEKPFLCQKTSECSTGSVCTANISWDGTSVITMCQPKSGTKAMGAKCAQAMDCQSGFCFDGVCTAACAVDTDCQCKGAAGCVQEQVCLDVWFELSGGKSDAARLCYPRVRCDSSADCGTLECVAYAEEAGWSTVCQKAIGAAKAGAKCAANDDCASGACLDGACRAVCATTANCGASQACTPTALDDKGQIGLCK